MIILYNSNRINKNRNINLSNKSEITFVIVSLEAIKGIKNCLKNIGDNYKVIVAENSNNKNIKNEIENNYRNTKCILLGKNYGYGSAANKGISFVKTKFAFLINADIEILDYQIKNIENEINKLNNNFSVATPFYDDFSDFIKIKYDKFFKNHKKIYISKDIESVPFIKGSSMLFNLSKFKEKIFDENFFFFFEEIDVCKRIKLADQNIYLINSVKIKHLGGRGIENKKANEISRFRNWHYYWSSFYYHKKHYGFYSSFTIHSTKLIKFFFLKYFYKFSNKFESEIFDCRFRGLLSSILGKKSSEGPDYGGR